MRYGTRNEGADLRDRNETKRLTELIKKWKPRPTKGSEVAGRDANQKRKEGQAYVSGDKPKGERPVKGGGDHSDKSKMGGKARVPNGQRGDDSQIDRGRAQGASEASKVG